VLALALPVFLIHLYIDGLGLVQQVSLALEFDEKYLTPMLNHDLVAPCRWISAKLCLISPN
jgi:hypothetical protein